MEAIMAEVVTIPRLDIEAKLEDVNTAVKAAVRRLGYDAPTAEQKDAVTAFVGGKDIFGRGLGTRLGSTSNTLLFNVGGASNTLLFNLGGTSNTLLFSVGGTSNTLLFSVGGASNTLGFMRYHKSGG